MPAPQLSSEEASDRRASEAVSGAVELDGEKGDVILSGIVREEHVKNVIAHALRILRCGVACGDQPAESDREVLSAAFDQAVGVQQHGRAFVEVDVHSTVGAADSERRTGFLVEQDDCAITASEDGWEMAR